MTLNGRNSPLAEINKNSGAHQKNFNEDRPILSAAKCRPMDLFFRNMKYMRMFAGVPSETGVMYRTLATYTCVHVLLDRIWASRSKSPKVIDFDTNRKRVCDLLLVGNSNRGPILHRFRDIAGFCASGLPHPYFTLILGCFLWTRPPMFVSPRLEQRPWSIRPWNYFQSIPTCAKIIPEGHGRTDGRRVVASPRSA